MNDPKSALPSVAGSALDLIGRTPMLEVRNLDTGPCRLFLKLESQNPGGSIKDRVARSMIEAAEADGSLKPGGVIIEATAGNTGLGLAQVATLKGYKLILIVPDKMAREKILHLRAMGVDVRLTRSDVGKGHPEYYQDMAQTLAQSIPGAIYVNQFSNPANPLAHETGTGPEILDQMGGDVDAVVVGVGSGGTLTGIGRFLAKASPKTKMVLADPVGSILCDYVATGTYGEAGSWIVEGIGEDFIPDNAQMDFVSKAYSISDRESVDTARLLLRKEGVLAGSSSGCLLAAALKYCREQTQPQRVVTLVCDTGAKYLTKMFNDMWLAAHGFDQRELHGDLRDLIAKRYADGGVVAIGPQDTLMTAYNRMRSSDISQLPVVDHGKLVGILDESDILAAVEGRDEHRTARFKTPVAEAMTREVNTLQASQGVEALPDVFDRDEVALVVDGDEFVGVITRVDLINHLRLEA
ncbi:pyridoxal-phosphate dependent enzyme [Caulobacter endophyticus]|uniref:Cysteine synthase B n=1 Tax=Caulobacter endophyticus TaxID=2172652 RepID=A0A2T9JZJ0_9CAUL|nr:cystathionine beta-synthase [Caulobacter endophyticus]PVM89152.1 cystathionine beta-synthase [Caulobacter endophyticus]